MDILVSAIVGDLVSRSATFLISKYFREQHPGIDEILQRLQRVVLRIDTVVEEAEGRLITNQGMLRQLKVLRQEMYRGHYVIDALRFQAAHDEEEASHSSVAAAPPRSGTGPAKRLRFSGGNGGGGSSDREAAAMSVFGASRSIRGGLQRVVEALEDTMDHAGMKEFLSFLASYPRVLRQPYCAYLLLENCMFGRQSERQRVLDFLLRPSSSSCTSLSVLPIVGPLRVGKSTLVEHVCRDESVRDHFSTIIFFPEGSVNKDQAAIGGFQVRHRQNSAPPSRNRMLLAIVEIAGGDIDEGTWRRLKASVTGMAPSGGGSKIIVTSRSERVMNLGTTGSALRLHRVPPDAHWYFFKSLAFGSTDPDEHPHMAAMAMEIASEQIQCLMKAHIIAGLLRDNLDARFWRGILERVRAYRRKMQHDKRPDDVSSREYQPPITSWRLGGRSCKYFMICKHHQSESSSEQVPKIRLQDVILGLGGRLPRGEFQVLALRSCIPPYYNYNVTCMMPAPQPAVGKKKRA
uniref:Uncharacterized protein n=1 Tax=Avena sativa TaxID=4498 RepID=A0ACD5X8S6_AVESA